jgi:hypothetical protein
VLSLRDRHTRKHASCQRVTTAASEKHIRIEPTTLKGIIMTSNIGTTQIVWAVKARKAGAKVEHVVDSLKPSVVG